MRSRVRVGAVVRAALAVGVPALLVATPGMAAESCRQSVGAARASRMVEQCQEVSPATHPPCNAANACALIVDEIRRGCAFVGSDAPGFCGSYRK